MARRARYPSDTSDEQWALIEPLLPEMKTGGRPENIVLGALRGDPRLVVGGQRRGGLLVLGA
jgi:hypothetical protein